MQNPNLYDDEQFTQASMELNAALPAILDSFWSAGASLDDIADQLGSVFENCMSGDLATSSLKVEISGP